MTNYTKSTNFASKDSLASGNALKIVKGTEIDTEFNNIATAVSTKADSASPTFTGTPVAPTASAGTNTTQLATTAFVKAANDVQDTAIALKAPLASPAFTGTPSAPTAAVDANTTQVANVTFVLNQAASATPLANGTAAVGTSKRYARQDHVHPSPLILSATALATTSGTIATFTGIPTGTKRVVFMLSGVSTNSTSILQFRIGTASGLETTGYAGHTGCFDGANTTGNTTSTVGIPLSNSSAAASTFTGTITCVLLNSTTNTWVVNSIVSNTGTVMAFTSYVKSLAAELTQVSLSTQSGTGVFDAGSVNILYE